MNMFLASFSVPFVFIFFFTLLNIIVCPHRYQPFPHIKYSTLDLLDVACNWLFFFKVRQCHGQLCDTSYPGSPILGSVRPGSPERARLSLISLCDASPAGLGITY